MIVTLHTPGTSSEGALDATTHAETMHFLLMCCQAQKWLKRKIVPAIQRCPGRAAIVLDNAHILRKEDVLLLDPLLLLFDDNV